MKQQAKQDGPCFFAPEELMTVKEAMYHLKISRSTLSRMRDAAELSTVCRNRNVFLIRKEVEDAYGWYSVRKGKV